MKAPQHPSGPAFNEARDRIAFLETRLLDEQRAQYDAFVKAQEREKEEQKQKAARAKAAYDQAKEKAPHLVKNYDPPVKIRDPYLRKMALDAQDQHHKVTALERTQMENRLRLLERLDRQRERERERQQTARDITQRAARPEFTRAAASKDGALERAFQKAERKQEERQDRTRTDEHSHSRER